MMKKRDLKQLIKREIYNDTEKDSLRNYIILDKINEKSTIKSWQVLFISASVSPSVRKILEYIYKLPNQIGGINLYPIESYNLIKNVINDEKVSKKDNEVYCLISQTKVSGIRQSIFHNHQILFTRLLDYDANDKNFIKKYEKDLYASYEYLKRIYPDISIDHFKIMNIFPDETLSQIKNMKNIEFNIQSFSPFQISEKFNDKYKLSKSSKNSDLLFTRSIFLSKKFLLSFFTPYIIRGKKIYMIMRLSYFANLLALLAIGLFTYISITKLKKSVEITSVVKIKKAKAINELSLTNKKIKIFEAQIKQDLTPEYSANEIIEISEVFNTLKYKDITPFKEYSKLGFVSSIGVKITTFSYNVRNFNRDNPNNIKHNILLTGKILNKSGNVDDIFISYDKVKSKFMKEFEGYRVTISELPKNINLAEKYYDFDIKINIEKLWK